MGMRDRTKIFFVILIWLLLSGVLFGQAEADSMGSSQAITITKSPRGAVLRSLVFPGWGQWYNGQKLKAVLVIAGEAALVGNIVYYRQKAIQSVEETERVFYEDTQSRMVWLLAAVHLLSLVDAYVDATLWDFDTGPDLSVASEQNMGRIILLSFSWRL